MRLFPGVLYLLLAACARAGSSDVTQSPSRVTEYRGKVVVTGTEPATSVQLTGEGNLELIGGLEPELRRLAGATVMVQGALQGQKPLLRLEVQSYEITDIDGEVPSTGVLLMKDDQVWLAGKDTLQLDALPENLRAKEGAKVWIVGERSGQKLEVQSYGVIRE
jgi:hypothetical protein